tara:strand:+ start:359 stop:634 length:276 start_codon:yes stop_codon:yes gene_type:complete
MGIGPQNLGAIGASSKSKPCGAPFNKIDRSKPGMSNAGKYPNVTKFAGPDGTFPINTLKRGRSALALAHNAKDPDAIKRNVYKEYPQLKDT